MRSPAPHLDLSKDKERHPSNIQRTFIFAIARSPDCTQRISGEGMTSDQSPAGTHLQMMERRIEQQIEKIERLKQSGEDATEAVRRLSLLHHALNEMRIQLGQLSPTERDSKKPDTKASAAVALSR